MGDVPRRTWGAKYSLRKALTRLTGPRKVRKMATIQAFCAWRDPGSNPEEAASGAKTGSRAAPALRLSLPHRHLVNSVAGSFEAVGGVRVMGAQRFLSDREDPHHRVDPAVAIRLSRLLQCVEIRNFSFWHWRHNPNFFTSPASRADSRG